MNTTAERVSIESTVHRARPETSLTLAYCAAFAALGLTTALLGPTLPGLAEHTRSRLDEISFLFTARSLGFLLVTLRVGRLYDRAPGNPLMATTLIVMALMMAVVPLVPLLWLLALAMLILGAAEGALDVGGNTLLVWVHGLRVGPYLNGLHFFYGVGAFIAPLVVACALSLRLDITAAYWTVALLILPVAVWLLRLPGPTARTTVGDDRAEKFNPRLVVLVALFLFLYLGAEVAFGGWIYTYAVRLKLADVGAAAYLTSAFWGALTLGRLLAIPLAARLRPVVILLGDLAGCFASLGILLCWPGSTFALWLGTIGLGLAMASIFPATLSLAGRRLQITGQITGWFLVGASAGAMSLPWLIGQLFESTGAHIVVVSILLDLLASALILILLLRSSASKN